MITLIVVGAGTAVLGFLLGRPTDKRERCTARNYERMWDSVKQNYFNGEKGRCAEKADPRCEGGFCTPHCRAENRCGAECLKSRARALQNM